MGNRKKKHERNLCGVTAAGVGQWASESITDQLSETFFSSDVFGSISNKLHYHHAQMDSDCDDEWEYHSFCLSYKPPNFDWYCISRKSADCQCLNFNYWSVDWFAYIYIYQSATRVSHYHCCDDVIKFRTSGGHITTTQLNCSDPLSTFLSQTQAIMTRQQYDGIIRLYFFGFMQIGAIQLFCEVQLWKGKMLSSKLLVKLRVLISYSTQLWRIPEHFLLLTDSHDSLTNFSCFLTVYLREERPTWQWFN